ncbi:MAG TPA: NAD(P)-dependent oxidoreductase [Thermomicrobiales bacterium]|nr:NAD(P)-dependent oxidoreductase [Thermomicrobiales bacterium]
MAVNVAERPIPGIQNEQALDALLSEPPQSCVEAVAALDGDIMILGAGGKMGPTVARMARRAVDEAGVNKRVIAVSRFGDGDTDVHLRADGVETIACDLLDHRALAELPDARNILFLAGRKFGSSGAEWLTWAMNTYLPGVVMERFPESRFVVLSTGNVYPMLPVTHGGATEETPVAPVGEYAESCLGRERVMEHFSRQRGTPVTLIRLNYAVELRYGILLDVAKQVQAGTPIDLAMGNVNGVWQGDAAAYFLQAFSLCASPPEVLNVTGPETISVRWLAHRFAELLDTPPPAFVGVESDTALLNNAGRCFRHFGYPRVSLDQMVEWVADWLRRGGRLLDKPTHFEARDGRF